MFDGFALIGFQFVELGKEECASLFACNLILNRRLDKRDIPILETSACLAVHSSTSDDPVQSSFRLNPQLYQNFRAALEDRNEKATSVISGLIEKWVERVDRSGSARRSRFARSYLSSLPLVAAIKDLAGKILFGNREFSRLIGLEDKNIVGKLPEDYVDDPKSAELIARLDETVRREGKPILCIEHLTLNGRQPQDRVAIRFPVPPDGEIELTGVIGFAFEELARILASMGPEPTAKRRYEFSTEPKKHEECPSHCLKDFLHSLPAIATLKNLDGRLLCVNTEYSTVFGKQRSEVENRLSSEIWGRPFADLIGAHDEIVRTSKRTWAFIESVPTREGPRDRLDFRFPIFDSENNLEMTGTLSFDYQLIKKGLDRLRTPGPAARAYLFVDGKDSLKLVYSAE
jgi:PAS domain-containing protein